MLFFIIILLRNSIHWLSKNTIDECILSVAFVCFSLMILYKKKTFIVMFSVKLYYVSVRELCASVCVLVSYIFLIIKRPR